MLTSQLNELIAKFLQSDFDYMDNYFFQYLQQKYPEDKKKQKKYCYTMMLSVLFFSRKYNYIQLYRRLFGEHTEYEYFEFFNECKGMCLSAQRVDHPNYANLDQIYLREEEWILVLNKMLDYGADQINGFRETLKTKVLKIKHDKSDSVLKYCRSEDYNLSFFLSEAFEAFKTIYEREKQHNQGGLNEYQHKLTARFSRLNKANHDNGLITTSDMQLADNENDISADISIVCPDKKKEKERLVNEIKEYVRRTNQYKLSTVKLMSYIGEIDPIYTEIRQLINEQKDAIQKIKREKITGRLQEDFGNYVSMGMLNFLDRGSSLSEENSKNLLRLLLNTDPRQYKMLTERKAEYAPHVKRMIRKLREKIFDEKFSILKGKEGRNVEHLKEDLERIFDKYGNLENSDYFLLDAFFKNADEGSNNEVAINNILDKVSTKIVGMVNKVLLDDSDFTDDEIANEKNIRKNYETGQKNYDEVSKAEDDVTQDISESNVQMLNALIKEQNHKVKQQPVAKQGNREETVTQIYDYYDKDFRQSLKANQTEELKQSHEPHNFYEQHKQSKASVQSRSSQDNKTHMEKTIPATYNQDKNVFHSDLNSDETDRKEKDHVNTGMRQNNANNELDNNFTSFNPLQEDKKSMLSFKKEPNFETFVKKGEEQVNADSKDNLGDSLPQLGETYDEFNSIEQRIIREARNSAASRLSKITEQTDTAEQDRDSSIRDLSNKDIPRNNDKSRSNSQGKGSDDTAQRLSQYRPKGRKPSEGRLSTSFSKDKKLTIGSRQHLDSSDKNSVERKNSGLMDTGSVKNQVPPTKRASGYSDIHKKKETLRNSKDKLKDSMRASSKSIDKQLPLAGRNSRSKLDSLINQQQSKDVSRLSRDSSKMPYSDIIEQKKNSVMNKIDLGDSVEKPKRETITNKLHSPTEKKSLFEKDRSPDQLVNFTPEGNKAAQLPEKRASSQLKEAEQRRRVTNKDSGLIHGRNTISGGDGQDQPHKAERRLQESEPLSKQSEEDKRLEMLMSVENANRLTKLKNPDFPDSGVNLDGNTFVNSLESNKGNNLIQSNTKLKADNLVSSNKEATGKTDSRLSNPKNSALQSQLSGVRDSISKTMLKNTESNTNESPYTNIRKHTEPNSIEGSKINQSQYKPVTKPTTESLEQDKYEPPVHFSSSKLSEVKDPVTKAQLKNVDSTNLKSSKIEGVVKNTQPNSLGDSERMNQLPTKAFARNSQLFKDTNTPVEVSNHAHTQRRSKDKEVVDAGNNKQDDNYDGLQSLRDRRSLKKGSFGATDNNKRTSVNSKINNDSSFGRKSNAYIDNSQQNALEEGRSKNSVTERGSNLRDLDLFGNTEKLESPNKFEDVRGSLVDKNIRDSQNSRFEQRNSSLNRRSKQQQSQAMVNEEDDKAIDREDSGDSFDVYRSGVKESIQRTGLKNADSLLAEPYHTELAPKESQMNSLERDGGVSTNIQARLSKDVKNSLPNQAFRKSKGDMPSKHDVRQNEDQGDETNQRDIKTSDGSAIQETKYKNTLKNIESGGDKQNEIVGTKATMLNSLVENLQRGSQESIKNDKGLNITAIESNFYDFKNNLDNHLKNSDELNNPNETTILRSGYRITDPGQSYQEKEKPVAHSETEPKKPDNSIPVPGVDSYYDKHKPDASDVSNIKDTSHSQMGASKIDRLRSAKTKKGMHVSSHIGITEPGEKNIKNFFKNFWGAKADDK